MSISLPPELSNTDDKPFHTQFPAEKWQEILEQAMADHRSALASGKRDPEALQAIKDASEALNTYDKEEVQQSSLGQVGRDFANVGGGIKDTITGIPAGISQLLDKAGQGNFIGMGQDIVQGAAELGKGMLAPWELAMRELTDEQISNDERDQMLRQGGAGLLGAATLSSAPARAVGRGIKAPFTAIKEGTNRLGLRNRQIEALTKRAATSDQALNQLMEQRAATGPLNQEILTNRATASGQAPAQAQMKTDLLQSQIEQAPSKTVQETSKARMLENDVQQIPLKNEQFQQKTRLLENELGQGPTKNQILGHQLERDPLTTENIYLRNELLRRKLEGDGPETGNPDPTSIPPTDPIMPPDILQPPKRPTVQDIGDPYGLDADMLNDLNNKLPPENKISPVTGQQIPPIDNIKPAFDPIDFALDNSADGSIIPARHSIPLSDIAMQELLRDLFGKNPPKPPIGP